MKIVAVAGGVGGARFVRGLRRFCDSLTASRSDPQEPHHITVIGNTGDDITLFGLRVCPDLDTLAYTLGGGIDESQGWGRVGDSRVVQGELAAYGAEPQWFGLGDLDMATHIARSQWLGQGLTLSQVTARIAERWGLPAADITLLPMSDEPVETHVVIDVEEAQQAAHPPLGANGQSASGDDAPEQMAVHFQQWWVGMGARPQAHRFTAVGLDRARPAPGVLEAIREADVVLLPPSNPVVSIGIVLGVPGVRAALRDTVAPVVGVSPIVGGAPVRGHADACLAALGLPCTPEAVAGLYRDFLDGWLVHDGDAGTAGPAGTAAEELQGIEVRSAPLLMRDPESAAALAGAALTFATDLQGRR